MQSFQAAVLTRTAIALTMATRTRDMRSKDGVSRFLPTMLRLGCLSMAVVAGCAPPVSSASTAPGATPTAIALPTPGNPDGHAIVAVAGRPVSTAHPDQIIGNGTPTSCTSAAVVAAVATGGVITFDCGPRPTTITMTATAMVPNTRRLVVLDGGGKVTLSGGGKRRILFSDACAGKWSTDDCVDQSFPQIVVQNLTFQDGFDGTPQRKCTAQAPQCWFGGVNGGGAIYVEGGQFKAINSWFIDNRCRSDGPDLGGGAIRASGMDPAEPVYITHDTFSGNACSNGGALSGLFANYDVANSLLVNNKAIGWGANPAKPGTPGGGSGGAIYTDGNQYNLGIAGTAITGTPPVKEGVESSS